MERVEYQPSLLDHDTPPLEADDGRVYEESSENPERLKITKEIEKTTKHSEFKMPGVTRAARAEINLRKKSKEKNGH